MLNWHSQQEKKISLKRSNKEIKTTVIGFYPTSRTKLNHTDQFTVSEN